jgi:hypothetical protein
MTLLEFLDWLEATPVAHAISKSHHLVGAVLQVVHIVGFISLLAAVVLLALRSFNVVLAGYDLRRLNRELGWALWGGLALTIVSGTLMFVSSPKLYAWNQAFDVKIVLLPFAIAIQGMLFQRVAVHRGGALPAIVSAASAVVWFAIGVAGRVIGFV